MYEFNSEDVFRFTNYINASVKQKGNELFFQYCPYCNGGNHDKETMSVNIDNGTFKCFRASCGKQGHFVELARDFNFKLENIEVTEYKKLPQKKIEVLAPAVEYLKSRGISEAITRQYNVTSALKNDNILVFPFYDEQNTLQFLKYRNTKYNGQGNKEWCEKATKPILFGMNKCNGFERLVITEGQIDSLSLAECGIENAVSVPTGAMGFTWLANVWDWITKFKEIIVFGDCEKGKITLIDTLIKRLPKEQIIKCVQQIDYLCEKDANAILQRYGKDAIIKAIENAKVPEVKYVKQLADVKAVDMTKLPKIKTNIRSLDRVIGGLYMGQVVLVSGKRGEGKSTFASQLMAEAIDQGYNAFAYSGELPDFHFKNWLDLQIAGGNNIESAFNEYNDMEYYLLPQTIERINEWYRNKAYIFDNSAIQDDEYEGLLKIVEDAVCRYNIKFVLLDNLMTALDDDVQSDLYRQQSRFVKALVKMAKTLDITIVLIAHPKKNNGEFTNDTVSGASEITNLVDVVLNYERCTDSEEGDSKITVTKNRLTGRLIRNKNAIRLVYSGASKRIAELGEEGKQKEYSCFQNEFEQMGFREIKDISQLPF